VEGKKIINFIVSCSGFCILIQPPVGPHWSCIFKSWEFLIDFSSAYKAFKNTRGFCQEVSSAYNCIFLFYCRHAIFKT
jgi:hypothetical protein